MESPAGSDALTAGSQTVLPTVGFSPATTVEFIAAANISADTALLLETLTGWDAQIWLTLQAKWDLWHALKARGHKPSLTPAKTG